jgi:phage repressor protein C with HTH and peptisase S24 domain
MDESVDIQALKERIETRLAQLGISSRKASLKTGRGTELIRNIFRAAESKRPYSPRTDTIDLVAKALETTAEWLLRGAGEPPAGPAVSPEQIDEVRTREFTEWSTTNPRISPLPVFAAVEGGPGDMVVSTDPIDHVTRPWFLKAVRDGYAVIVVGESMEPAFEAGDLAIVNPRLTPIRNKDAIFISGGRDGEFIASIKRLIRSTSDAWIVKQFNPEQELTYKKEKWTKAFRVVGKYYGG